MKGNTAPALQIGSSIEEIDVKKLFFEYKSVKNMQRKLRKSLNSALNEAIFSLNSLNKVSLEQKLRSLKRILRKSSPVFLVTRVNE